MRLVKREQLIGLPLVNLAIPLAALVVAFGIGALILLGLGFDPLRGYRFLLIGALGSKHGIAETLVRMTPLLLTGLGIGLAMRSGIWNIGAEGQFYLGALASVWIGLSITSGNSVWVIALELAVGMLAGALWALIPAVLRAIWDVNEVITTIMFNYVAILLIQYIVQEPLREASGFAPMTDKINVTAELPILLPKTRLHAGLLIALVATGLAYLLLFKTVLGYKLRAAGENPFAARYAGIKVRRNIMLALELSGGLAGVAGMVEVTGVHHRLLAGISPGYGFTGIIVALLGRRHPMGILLAAFLLAALDVGGRTMEQRLGIPYCLTYIIESLTVFFVLAAEVFTRYKFTSLHRRPKGEES